LHWAVNTQSKASSGMAFGSVLAASTILRAYTGVQCFTLSLKGGWIKIRGASGGRWMSEEQTLKK